jgi:CubicO group peptidase (beta-lactamase class C family)
MLYRGAYSKDMGQFRLEQNLRVAPLGEHFNYASGDTNLLMKILQKAIHAQTKPSHQAAVYDAYPWTEFFDKIGVKEVTFEQDESGVFTGSSYLHGTALSFAKIAQWMAGYLPLQPEALVPPGFIPFMTELNSGFKSKLKPTPLRAYGAGVWLNQAVKSLDVPKPIEALEDNAYVMSGHSGQSVVIAPHEKLILVRLGNDSGFSLNETFALLLRGQSLKGKGIKD